METVQAALWVVILLVAMALVFDFMNGFHDAANSIATVVSTGVLKPTQAVVFAAFFNFIAIFVFYVQDVFAVISPKIPIEGSLTISQWTCFVKRFVKSLDPYIHDAFIFFHEGDPFAVRADAALRPLRVSEQLGTLDKGGVSHLCSLRNWGL